MSFEDSCAPVFAGHQTFHPRFGWLKKGVDAFRENPRIFAESDATVQLGVGKNMVEAIKFWCQAFKLIENREGQLRVAEFAERIFGKQGVDPYLEDVSTLWLLHLRLLADRCQAPVWWLFFNEFGHATFSQKRLADSIAVEVADSVLDKKPNRSSLDKDVDALIRMYTLKSKKARQSIEDVLDSPFRDLGIVIPNDVAEGSFRLVFGRKPNLNGFVVQYACLQFMRDKALSASTISLNRLVSDEGSPGKTLKLDVETLKTYLEEFDLEGVQVSSAAGSLQMSISKSADILLEEAFNAYYLKGGSIES